MLPEAPFVGITEGDCTAAGFASIYDPDQCNAGLTYLDYLRLGPDAAWWVRPSDTLHYPDYCFHSPRWPQDPSRDFSGVVVAEWARGNPCSEEYVCICSTEKCHDSCTGCIGPNADQCITCAPSHVRLDRPDSSAFYCLECHSSCDSCSGPGELDCIGCAAGYVANGNYKDDYQPFQLTCDRILEKSADSGETETPADDSALFRTFPERLGFGVGVVSGVLILWLGFVYWRGKRKRATPALKARESGPGAPDYDPSLSETEEKRPHISHLQSVETEGVFAMERGEGEPANQRGIVAATSILSFVTLSPQCTEDELNQNVMSKSKGGQPGRLLAIPGPQNGELSEAELGTPQVESTKRSALDSGPDALPAIPSQSISLTMSVVSLDEAKEGEDEPPSPEPLTNTMKREGEASNASRRVPAAPSAVQTRL